MISRTVRPQHICLVSSALFALAVTGCGLPGSKKWSPKDEASSESLPTRQNYVLWEKTWDKKSWIVAHEESPESQTKDSDFKNQFVRELLKKDGVNYELTEENSSMGAFLSKNISVSSVTKKTKKIDNKDIKFLKFRFENGVSSNFLSQARENETDNFRIQNSLSQWDTLEKMEGVAWAEPNLQSELFQATPNPGAGDGPPEFAGSMPNLEAIKAKAAFLYGKTQNPKPRTVNVAVIDTGVDSGHPDLKGQMFVIEKKDGGEGTEKDGIDNDGNGYIDDIHGIDATISKGESDPLSPGWADLGGPGATCIPAPDGKPQNTCGHGTHIAGIIAAKEGGSLETLGVCPTCKILSLRVAKRDVTVVAGKQVSINLGIDDASQIHALDYITSLKRPSGAGEGTLYVSVVNLSLGKYLRSRAMSFKIRELQQSGIIVVAAAGNDNTERPSFPAAYSSVVAVCATGQAPGLENSLAKAPFSNFGEWVDICAPGAEIRSTLPGGGQDVKSGTSQAAPFVAGAAGYLLSIYPTLTAAQIIDLLKNGADADKLYSTPYNKFYASKYPDGTQFSLLGTGFLNLEAAVKRQSSGRAVQDDLRIKDGCVVGAAVIGNGGLPGWGVLLSSPFLLGQFCLLIVLKRKLTRNRQEKSLLR